MGFYFSFLLAPFFGYIIAVLYEKQIFSDLRVDMNNFKTEEEYLDYILQLTNIIYQRRHKRCILELEGLLKKHTEVCEKKSCYCTH